MRAPDQCPAPGSFYCCLLEIRPRVSAKLLQTIMSVADAVDIKIALN